MTFTLQGFDLPTFIHSTLAEDLGEGWPGGGRDVTSESVIPAEARFIGVMDSRDAITVAGLPIAAAFFRHLDPDAEIELLVADGDRVAPGTHLMRITGMGRALLTAERSALNTVQHLSGIATMTREYVDAMGATKAVLLDTRKTIPGLRVWKIRDAHGRGHQSSHGPVGRGDDQGQPCRHRGRGGSGCRPRQGGGHRQHHLRSRPPRPDRTRAGGGRNPSPARQYGAGHAGPRRGAGCGRVPCEASGGVRLDTIAAIASSGVDYVSVGRLTQSAPAADIGLDFEEL
jgi:nicotinate-nucleotide pyrophosphorylase (carboxylating)